MRIAALLFAGLLAGTAVADIPDAAPMALHLLDYIAVDYGGAVAQGAVKSEDEYKEMVEFAGEVAAIFPTLQTLAAQATVGAIIIAGLWWTRRPAA